MIVLSGCSHKHARPATKGYSERQHTGASPCVAMFEAVCDNRETASEEVEEAEVEPMAPLRHIAWLEGDYQTDYETNRSVAEVKAKKWEGKIPEVKDTDDYLQYLSVIDA